MGLKDELKSILRYVRRLYYFKFRGDYVMGQLRRRKGKCGMHGCCDLTVLNRLFFRKCLDRRDRTKCLKQGNLPFMCHVYPFDEKDKHHLTGDICNFYWESSEKKETRVKGEK